MKTAKQLLESVDNLKFSMIAMKLKDQLVEAKTKDDLVTIAETVQIEPYKRNALVEYLDANKDMLLAMDTFDEGDAVVTSDDFAPYARKHGKIVTKGSHEGTYLVKFDDESEQEVPDSKLIRKDVTTQEQKKYVQCFALLEDHSLIRVKLDSIDNAYQIIEDRLDKSALVIFQEEQYHSPSSVTESEMTDEQKTKREEIVKGLKKNSADLKKRYGDRWESVMYAIATKKAMEESVADVLMRHRTGKYTIEILRIGEYFRVQKINMFDEVVDVQDYSSMHEAEDAATLWLL